MTGDHAPARVPILLPDLGTGSEPVRICAWLADPGQPMTIGERIVQVVVPGISFDVTAPVSGELTEVTCPLGALVRPGEILGWMLPSTDSADCWDDSEDPSVGEE